MSVPTWVSVAKEVVGPFLTILAYVLGKAQKAGEASTLLQQVTAAVTDLKVTVIEHSKLLERHTALHEGQQETSRRTETKLDEFNRLLGEIVGQIRGLHNSE